MTQLVDLTDELSKDLAELSSHEGTTRALAAVRLKDSFEEGIGGCLVQALINELDLAAFSLMCFAVIPKWIVKLERKLATIDVWPFDSNRTAWLMLGTQGWRLPAIERQLAEAMNGLSGLLPFAIATTR
jgi:hypothetical protein